MRWSPAITRRDGPLFRAIVHAIATDVAAGRLRPGDRLPSHRKLAQQLGINFTTVTRAYREAARRGLVEGRGGRGTYVTSGRNFGVPALATRPFLDLTLNVPTPSPFAARALAETLGGLSRRDLSMPLLQYCAPGGRAEDRECAAHWLAELGVPATGADTLVTSGAQHALLSVLGSTRHVSRVLVEPLTYPGVLRLARMLRLEVAIVEADAEGMLPDALDRCGARHGDVVYLMPTLHNPTLVIADERRRAQLAEVITRRRLMTVEDDAFAPMMRARPRPLAALAPDFVYHVSGVSKCIAPGLRIAFIRTPDASAAARVAAAIHGTVFMPPPLLLEIAMRWIRTGLAERILEERRTEAIWRTRIAREVLGERIRIHESAFHAWLPLGAGDALEFVHDAERRGVGISPAHQFSAGHPQVQGARVCLGAAVSREELRSALQILDALVSRRSAGSARVA